MNSKNSNTAISKVIAALQANRAIAYDDGCPDKEYPEIVWHTYGIFDSNEIVVIARCGDLEVGMACPSGVVYPVMLDRVFGIDVSDRELSFRMANQIWSRHGAELASKALAIRDKGRDA